MFCFAISDKLSVSDFCPSCTPSMIINSFCVAGIIGLQENVVKIYLCKFNGSRTPPPSANKLLTLALKPRGGYARSPKQGYQWPHKKDLCPPKIKTNSKVTTSTTTTINNNHTKKYRTITCFSFP